MVTRPRNGLSLCAGGGGLDMGLMLAEPGFHTRAYVEWGEHPRRTIIAAQDAGYFAHAPIWDDVTTFDGKPFRGAIDTILAGYPCQPFSQAGQRKGTDDERHLWPDIARIIREIEPRWLFLENVAGHVTLGAEAVLREIRDMGFTTATGLFTAQETGATHERLRWYSVAYSDGRHTSAKREQCSGKQRFQPPCDGVGGASGIVGDTSRIGRDQGRSKSVIRGGRGAAPGTGCTVADTQSPNRWGELQQSGARGWRAGLAGNDGELANAKRDARHKGRHGAGSAQNSKREADRTCAPRPHIHPPGPSDKLAWANVLAGPSASLAPALGVNEILAWSLNRAATFQKPPQATSEPTVRRMVDGLALRSRALKLLGNGVHPLAAANAWRSLSYALGNCPLDLGAAGANDNGHPIGNVLKEMRSE